MSRRRRSRRNPSGLAWAMAAAGGTIAAASLYKAYSDYQVSQDDRERAAQDRATATTAPDEAARALEAAANQLEMAGENRQQSAILFGAFSLIGLGIAGFSLFRG